MLINVTLCALVRIRKMNLLPLIILSSKTAMKRKYLGLGITIDNKLTFKNHVKLLCRKVAQKIGALSRLLNHLINFQFLNKVTV